MTEREQAVVGGSIVDEMPLDGRRGGFGGNKTDREESVGGSKDMSLMSMELSFGVE